MIGGLEYISYANTYTKAYDRYKLYILKMLKKQKQIIALYKLLKKRYGHPQGQWHFDKLSATLSPSKGWSIWAKRPKTLKEKEWVLIEAVLAQITSWRNVKLAMGNLEKAEADSLKGVNRLSRRKLEELIRPAGFYKQKGEYLLTLLKFVLKQGGIKELEKMPIEELRRKLLELKGIGRETADSILLYALEKPVFVIDEYTRRLLKAKKITSEKNYEKLRQLFEKNIPRNWRLYQDFHALIVINAKNNRSSPT